MSWQRLIWPCGIWPAVILLIAGLGLHSFREFQKITGPLYRFRWVFEQVENGSLLLPVKIREKDLLIEEEEALNKMLTSLIGKMGTIKQESSAALKSIGELENTVNQGGEWGTTQIELLQAHRQHLEGLSTAIRFFRLQDEQQNTAVSTQNASIYGIELSQEEKNEPSSGTSSLIFPDSASKCTFFLCLSHNHVVRHKSSDKHSADDRR